MTRVTTIAVIGALGLGLMGCADPEIILPGEREDIRAVLDGGAFAEGETTPEGSRAIALAPQTRNAAWSQSHVSPAFRTAHPALGADLDPVWSSPIGQGDKRRARITATPVSDGARLFTLDSAAQVTATSTSGETLWSADLTPLRDSSNQAQGGGLAVAGGRLYVTSGFGLVAAFDAQSGDRLWEQRLGATGTGTPTVVGDVVYLVAGDTTAWALEADDGRIRWQIDGLADINNVAGGPAPAVADGRVLFSFGSAEVQAVFRQGGLRLWNATVAGGRKGLARSGIDDITGDPVIVGDRVFVGNSTGRTVALGLGDGTRLWTARDGAWGPVWPAGDSVFLVSDRNQLLRLDADTGAVVWETDLPGFVRENRPRKRVAIHAHHGPVLAGGRLIVASSDGLIRSFDPVTGAQVSAVEIPGGATTAPIVVDGTLYVVSSRGQLHAFR